MKKWALVTGGAVGIGKEITIDFAKQGINTIITYRKSKNEAENLKKYINNNFKSKIIIFKADSTNPEEIKNLFLHLKKQDIILSILINNAGDYLYKNILDLNYEEWKYIIDNNLNATYLVSNHFLKQRDENISSRIINIGYIHSGTMVAKTMITPYYIAKTGIYLLTLALAKELAGKNITVNMISPGIMENSVNVGKMNVYRYGKLSEITEAVNYLISDKADYINGSQIDIGGGFGI